eukprot:4675864-Prorocentrum_lima.AAC.1
MVLCGGGPGHAAPLPCAVPSPTLGHMKENWTPLHHACGCINHWCTIQSISLGTSVSAML